jgi:two-component system response regulator HydG
MSNINVLVVDDDFAVCRIAERMLSDAEYKVEISQSVAEALIAVDQNSFDVYIVDYKLPDGSGFDIAERIRSNWVRPQSFLFLVMIQVRSL